LQTKKGTAAQPLNEWSVLRAITGPSDEFGYYYVNKTLAYPSTTRMGMPLMTTLPGGDSGDQDQRAPDEPVEEGDCFDICAVIETQRAAPSMSTIAMH
jgi:hypothetical protein